MGHPAQQGGWRRLRAASQIRATATLTALPQTRRGWCPPAPACISLRPACFGPSPHLPSSMAAQLVATSSTLRAAAPQQRLQRRMQPAAGAPAGSATRRQAVRCSAAVKFAKYQGLGNDFILVSADAGPGARSPAHCWPTTAAAAAAACTRGERLQTPRKYRARCRLPPPQVDNRHQADPIITPDQAVKLCDRNFGIGGDGVRLAAPEGPPAATVEDGAGPRVPPAAWPAGRRSQPPSARPRNLSPACAACGPPPARCLPPQVIFALPAQNGTDYSMRIFNSDGSEPEMCGNGIRCLARFVAGAPRRAAAAAAAAAALASPGLLAAAGCPPARPACGCALAQNVSHARLSRPLLRPAPPAPDVDGSQPRQYKVHTLAGLIQPALLADGQVRGARACIGRGRLLLPAAGGCAARGPVGRCQAWPPAGTHALPSAAARAPPLSPTLPALLSPTLPALLSPTLPALLPPPRCASTWVSRS